MGPWIDKNFRCKKPQRGEYTEKIHDIFKTLERKTRVKKRRKNSRPYDDKMTVLSSSRLLSSGRVAKALIGLNRMLAAGKQVSVRLKRNGIMSPSQEYGNVHIK